LTHITATSDGENNMVRAEFVVVGVILVALGLSLMSTGYDRLQPSTLENVVSFAEAVSGQKAPEELHPPKTSGYLLLALGGVVVVAGLGVIIRSRSPRN
jgi:hypothetical protein